MEQIGQISELLAAAKDHSALYIEANELAAELTNQNARYKEAGEVFQDEPEILDIVRFGIAEEQEDTFANIQSLNPEAHRAFEILGIANCAIYNASLVLETDNMGIKTALETQEAVLEKEQERQSENTRLREETLLEDVERLAPLAVPMVRDFLKSHDLKNVGNAEITKLEEGILGLMEQQDDIENAQQKIEESAEKLESITGSLAESWELPIALLDQGISTFATLDDIPVEPQMNSNHRDEIEEIAKRHVDQPQATVYTAICLLENSGETITVDKIADVLYSPDVITTLSRHKLRARITTLLGPKVGGRDLRDILDAEGYILQYGWRRTLERRANGHTAINSRERIYRAIKKDQQDLFADSYIIETENHTDTFDSHHIYPSDSPAQTEATDARTTIPVREPKAHDDTDATTNPGDIACSIEHHDETHSQRKERLKNELISMMTGPAGLIIKTLQDYDRAIEEGGIHLGDLRIIYPDYKITDDNLRTIVGSWVIPEESYWLNSVNAVKLMLSIKLEDEAVRANITSKQWHDVVINKINELIQRELRGIKRRRQLQNQDATV